MPPLDPVIVEEILRREREKKRREGEIQPQVPADDPREIPDPEDRHDGDHDRDPGYEMPNPNERPRTPEKEEKKDEHRRGVDTSRITGSDEDDEGPFDIQKQIEELERREKRAPKPDAPQPPPPPEKKPE